MRTVIHFLALGMMLISKVIVAVNKMNTNARHDLFEVIQRTFAKLRGEPIFISLAAITGENIHKRLANIDWYSESVVEDLLAKIEYDDRNLDKNGAVISVQMATRGEGKGRGYLGRLDSGTLTEGDPFGFHRRTKK